MDLNQNDLTNNSIDIFPKRNNATLPVPNPSLNIPTPASQKEQKHHDSIKRPSKESLPSSSKELPKDQCGSVSSSQNSVTKGSFKKHLITNAAQRLKEVNSSIQSVASIDNRLPDDSKDGKAESLQMSSQKKDGINCPANSLPASTNKIPEKTIKSENNVSEKRNNLQDFEALDLEEATKEALRSLTSKLEPTSEASESRDILNEPEASGLSEKETRVKQLNIPKQHENGIEGYSVEEFKASGPNSCERFLNVCTLNAQNERKNLLSKNSHRSSGKSDRNEDIEPLYSGRKITETKVSSPVPYIRRKSKQSGRDKSHSTGRSNSREDIPRGNSIVSKSLNSLGSKGNNGEKSCENNQVSNFFSLSKPSDLSPKRSEENEFSKPKAADINVYQHLQIRGSGESAEKIGSEGQSNRSHHESSQNVSFSGENPFSEARKCGLTERLFTEPSSLNRGDSSKREKISEYILEIAESSKMSETNGYRTHGTHGFEDEEEDILSLESERLTSQKCKTQLNDSIKKISVRTFSALKSIIKPNDNILICCQAFVKIFAGLHEAIPSSFSIMSHIEWGNIKVLFNPPAKILNLVTSLPKLIETGKVPQRNITAALVSLTKVPYQPGEVQNEAFYHLYEFIVSAIEYFKYYKPELLNSWQQNTQESQEEMISMRSTYSQNHENNLLGKLNENCQARSPPRHDNLQKTLSTNASSNRRALQSTASPMKENRNSHLSNSRSPQREARKKTFLSEAKPKTLVFSSGMKSAQKSKSPIKKKAIKTENTLGTEDVQKESADQKVFTLEIDSEAITLQDEIELKAKQARDYKSKVNRLLVDHERYVKRLLKEQEDDRVDFERKDELQERKRLEEYLEFRESIEEEYLRELATEELQAKKEIKYKQNRAQREELRDEFMESIREHCFLETQKERKKNDKKKQLWEQYKKKMADKQVKRQKEAEENAAEKQELASKRIDSYAWKKKQATQERDMWKENYLMLEKLIGDAK